MPRPGDAPSRRPAYRQSVVDTIRTLANARHFLTADLRLAGFGQVLLIGDRQAVERVLAIVDAHADHDLVAAPDDLVEDR